MQGTHLAYWKTRSFTNSLSRFRSFEERFGIVFFTLALFLAMSPVLWAHEFKAGDIEVIHPWSRATPVGAQVAAGYFTLKNNGSTPDRLVSVTGEIAGMAQVHQMAVDAKGVMTMRHLADGLEIPAGGEVALKPGSFHIMFMNLKHPIKEGETFKGTLTFEKAGTVEAEYSVGAIGGEPMDHSMGMGGDHGDHGG